MTDHFIDQSTSVDNSGSPESAATRDIELQVSGDLKGGHVDIFMKTSANGDFVKTHTFWKPSAKIISVGAGGSYYGRFVADRSGASVSLVDDQ